jgi:hypothetical protein
LSVVTEFDASLSAVTAVEAIFNNSLNSGMSALTANLTNVAMGTGKLTDVFRDFGRIAIQAVMELMVKLMIIRPLLAMFGITGDVGAATTAAGALNPVGVVAGGGGTLHPHRVQASRRPELDGLDLDPSRDRDVRLHHGRRRWAGVPGAGQVRERLPHQGSLHAGISYRRLGHHCSGRADRPCGDTLSGWRESGLGRQR